MTSALALMVLGFLLGMRHATDPDHVIAVTTIVARERTRFGATAIGAAWGLGHTLTILLVGGGMILFGWVIPPRVGLYLSLVCFRAPMPTSRCSRSVLRVASSVH